MIEWRFGTKAEADVLLIEHHYLGPIRSGKVTCVVIGAVAGTPVAAMVWRPPTSRRLPSDGTWLELSRWCLTPQAGPDAGSRQHRATVRLLRDVGRFTSLVSYSDPSQGHTGALYRACNWRWAPTWQRLRPPPTGAGDWGTGVMQHVKDRWVFELAPDSRRAALLTINDRGAIRHWLRQRPSDHALGMARRSLAPDLASAVVQP